MGVLSVLLVAATACALVATPAMGGLHPKTHHKSSHHQNGALRDGGVGHKSKFVQYPALELPVAGAAPNAPQGAPYNVSDAYVLGLSSGGFLAVQMTFAYSSEFSGAGIFAAGPYYCAQGSISTALEVCVDALEPINLGSLESTTNILEGLGLIDGLKNLTNQPIYLFHGTSDRTVFAPVNQALYQMYLDYGANVFFNNATDANHAWISPTGPNACTESSAPYISNCNIDVEAELLNHMLQTSIAPPASSPTGNIYSFSQDQYAQALFQTSASTYSMDTTGYVYLPLACAAGKECELLVVIHGCEQGYYTIGNALIQDSNLNVYADTNNFIVLYPQAIASVLQSNPEGCWDWWGYTGGGSTLYATHGAPQMEIIRAVMKGLGFKVKSVENQLRAYQEL